jgi:FkbM family methyltransferase
MVAISRSNVRRVRRGNEGGGFLYMLDNIPYISQLSSADRLLLLCGAALLGTVTFASFFLISGIVTFSGGITSSDVSDPRLSPELRKMGLSDEQLLRRGGGKRIVVGPHKLDSEENAVALDIISILDCDGLQDEMEREWNAVLDAKKLAKESSDRWKREEEQWKREEEEWEQINNRNKRRLQLELDSVQDAVEFDLEQQENHNDIGGDGRDFMLDEMMMDDISMMGRDGGGGIGGGGGGGGDFYYDNTQLKLTARHLFCLAAEGITLPKSTTSGDPDPSLHCDIDNFEIRESLLSLWSSARAQISDDIIKKTLNIVTEHKETLRGHDVHIWYPQNDLGTEGMLRVLNSAFEGSLTYNFDSEPADEGHDDLYRFWNIPSQYVGENKLFVDVGSALGLTSMLIAYEYPRTTVVSIEPASPSWLIQNINFRCNLSEEQRSYVHPILAGVGTKHHDDNDSMMKMIWKPRMTTATRNWNLDKDFDFGTDIELTVHLRTLRAILAEATPEDLPLGTPISVLNLDCEGCEYNLIPSLHETSFKSIGLILGRTNWGFIPMSKKPSSERAEDTHKRVCTHYNFAKRCKECCDFPTLPVRPRLPSTAVEDEKFGDVEDESDNSSVRLETKTVADVAGSLCDGFEEWAEENKLHEVPDDYGWNEMSAYVQTDTR